MKRMVVICASALALTFGANAQLRVLSNGHIQLGDWVYRSSSGTGDAPGEMAGVINDGMGAVIPGIGQIIIPTPQDTTSTVSVLGTQTLNFSGGSLSFGGRKDVMISEPAFTNATWSPYGRMTLVGKGGISYSSASGVIFSYDPYLHQINTGGSSESNSPAFFYYVNLIAPKFLNSSDARYKSNVESLESMGELLNDLTPVSYNLNIPAKGVEADAAVQMDSPVSDADDRRSFGFIAQEVREIFPELVYEDAQGMLSVDYNGFIPLLVDAYKALNAKVAEQEEVIANLSRAANKTRGVASVEDIYGDDSVVLMQNRPNPFKTTTEIRCHLPEGVADAFICIYDLNGRQQMRLNLAERGDVSVSVSGSSLQPGIYIYSLIADGKEADTKRMILTE